MHFVPKRLHIFFVLQACMLRDLGVEAIGFNVSEACSDHLEELPQNLLLDPSELCGLRVG